MSNSRPLWIMAARNLLRNRRRTFATATAIIFGFVGLILLSAYIYRVEVGMRSLTVYHQQKGHVAVLKAGSLSGFSNRPANFILNDDDQKKILSAAQPLNNAIEFSGRFLGGVGLLTQKTKSTPVIIRGVEPELYARLLTHPQTIKWVKPWFPDLDSDAPKMATNPRLISVTHSLAELIGQYGPAASLSQGDREVQIVGANYFKDLNAVDAELGLFHSTGNVFIEDLSLIAPLALAQSLYATNGVEYVAFFLKNYGGAGSVAQRLRKTLGDGYEVFTYADDTWSPVYAGTMSFLYVMGQFFVFLILSAVALTIVNTTTLNLLERSRESGTLRAMGFSPANLRGLFVREAIVLCTFCLALGIVIAWALEVLINNAKIPFRPPAIPDSIPFNLAIHPGIAFLLAIIVFAITVISTAIVSNRQAGEKVVTLLNDQGA